MIKLYLILYTLVTSLLYTGLVAYFTTSTVGLGYIATVLTAVTTAIAFFREKIADIDHNKKIADKNSKIERMQKDLNQKSAMLHSVKTRVIHVAINVVDKDDMLTTMRDLASFLNDNAAINNIDFGEDVEAVEYLGLMKMSANAKALG